MSDTPTFAAPLPPGDLGWPLLGETLSMVKNLQGFLAQRRQRFGPIFKTNLLGHNVVFLSGAAAMADFLDESKITRDGGTPGNVRDLFGGSNMNMLDGNAHLGLKTIALQAFDREALASYLPTVERILAAALARWSSQGEVRAFAEYQRLAIELICANILGLLPGPPTQEILQDYGLVLAGMTALPLALPGTAFWKARRARDRLFSRLGKIVAEHRASPQNDGLSVLLQAQASDGRKITDQEVLLELHHIIIAGYIVCGLLGELTLRLARDPQLLARVRSEIDSQLPKGSLTPAGLAALPFTLQVVMEAKRMAPIMPIAFGRARTDFAVGGFRVPAGWNVYFALSLTSADPALFRAPQTFDPDRFSPARCEQNQHPHAFVPQGGGPPTGHRCLGLEYSTLVAMTFLTAALRGYSWEIPDQDLTYRWDRTPAEPRDGLRMRVRAR